MEATGQELPILPVNDLVAFPRVPISISIGVPESLKLLASIEADPRPVLVVKRRDNPPQELCEVGTICDVHLLRTDGLEDNAPRMVMVHGVERAKLVEITSREPFLWGRVVPKPDVEPPDDDADYRALREGVIRLFGELVMSSPVISNDVLQVAAALQPKSAIADFSASLLPMLSLDVKQSVLETFDLKARFKLLHEALVKEREYQRLEAKIRIEAEEKLKGVQREVLLREQLRAIQRELGQGTDEERDVKDLKARLEAAHVPPEVAEEANRQLERLGQTNAGSAEYPVLRTWLDWVAALPWAVSTGKPVDLEKAARVLDEDHHDLDKVKERILEFIAVLQLKKDSKGPLLCFAGPPGVGKTSVGKSIARALGRKFVRLSLGGIRDEAEIRGHRRTYVGALPGQILDQLKRAGSNDPVFMLDEIDKLGRDFQGDPAAALLEVLDPEQNQAFRDNYLDLPFDLSKVLFITTANMLDPVPPALRDRLEVLELPGYTEEEKLQIAKRFLVPRQLEQCGLSPAELTFSDDALKQLIRGYTREAGVRGLERTIGSLCRKHARLVASGVKGTLELDAPAVRQKLGPETFVFETGLDQRVAEPGVALGLAWTPAGGELIFVEVARTRGRGELKLTGQLGETMRESAQAALTWVKAHARTYGIDPTVFDDSDLHLHVPAGAVPKDGPSAGVVMVAALVSLLSGRRVRPRVAMSGEITLSGHVMPVGGVKDKVLAAMRAGIRELVLPEGNRANVEADVAPELLLGMTIQFVDRIDDALGLMLADPRSGPSLSEANSGQASRLPTRPRGVGAPGWASVGGPQLGPDEQPRR